MSQPEMKTEVARFRGAVLSGLFGMVAGFVVGFFLIEVFLPFSEPNSEARKWLPGIALLFGLGGAFWGGLFGIITGAIFGAEAAIKGALTKGILFGLMGTVVGFGVGMLLSGLLDRQWALLTDGSTSCALLGGSLGILLGTIYGARVVAKIKYPTSALR